MSLILFLGVDGGQTHTTAVIADADGRVFGRGVGGPSNHVGESEGVQRLTEAVSGSVGAACRQAGLVLDDVEFESACLGFTGGIRNKEPILRGVLRARHLLVTDDATIALAGAHDGGAGIVLIAGTGSICVGRNASGRTARAGGWGYLFGDEGAAFDIVRQALRAALRMDEGWGPFTALHARLLAATDMKDMQEMRRRFYTTEYPRDRVAGFATLVDEAASDGDAVAIEILDQAGDQLAALALVVRRSLFAPDESARVARLGGMFESVRLRDGFVQRVEAVALTSVVAPRHGPEIGALVEAYRGAGVEVPVGIQGPPPQSP